MFSILLYSFLLLLALCPSACGHLPANCSSGMNVSNVQSGVIEIKGTISTDSYLQLSCVLKLDKLGKFLRIKTKRNDKKKGFLLVSLYQQGDSSLLGHVDLSEPTPVWNTFSICPTGLTNDQNTGEKLLSVVGKGSELSFTVQIAEGASEIALDQPHTVNVQGDEVSVFQFIPPQDISDKQLDITATSQSTVAAYLKVSQNCKEVDVQKDLESINYKKESLRLSFATKGRITLSNFSIPPLMDSVSRWFIGISLKNLSGDVKLSESKIVTLKLTRSFDYSYTTPSCVLFVVSLVAGTLVSIIAYFLFEESLTQVKPGEGDKFNYNTDSEVLVCERSEETRYHWFSSGPKTHSYIIRILGIVLMIGAFQFVLSYWDTMIQEGNRDKCYYNEFCYRVVNYDIPFNLIISNLTYIIHGLILAVWVLILEAKVKVGGKAKEERYPFSIGYTFSWALVFQGLLSALCHLCPSRFTYLFELVFMFVIAGLTLLLLLYNGTKQNSSKNEKDPVGVTNFFVLLTVSPVIFHYLLNSRLNTIMQGFFCVIQIIWWLVKVLWVFLKLNMHPKFAGNNKFNAFLIILGGLLISGPINMFYWFSDPDQMFSMTGTFSILAEILTQALLWEKLFKCESGKLLGKGTLQDLFISLTFIISLAAVGVFTKLPTTNQTLSPENSRDKNQECVIFGFFDWHGLGHFLSSFALLMGAFVVMFKSSELENDICYTSFPTVGNLLTEEGVGKCFEPCEFPNSETLVISKNPKLERFLGLNCDLEEDINVYSELDKRLRSEPSENNDLNCITFHTSVKEVPDSGTSFRKRPVRAEKPV